MIAKKNVEDFKIGIIDIISNCSKGEVIIRLYKFWLIYIYNFNLLKNKLKSWLCNCYDYSN